MLLKLRLFPTILFGLFAVLPSAVVSAPQSAEICQSRAFGNSVFRAYANPKPVSRHAFSTNGSSTLSLDRLAGPRALLVNFWTTWCTPCIEEMPSMDRLQGRISRDQLLILPLVRDGKGLSEAVRFYKTHDIRNLPIAADRFGKISRDHHIGPVPQTLFVDQHGLVKGILIGGVDWESEPVLELLHSCLKVTVEQKASRKHETGSQRGSHELCRLPLFFQGTLKPAEVLIQPFRHEREAHDVEARVCLNNLGIS